MNTPMFNNIEKTMESIVISTARKLVIIWLKEKHFGVTKI